MLEIFVPGYKNFPLAHLVLDYNGTLARDGELLPGVREQVVALSQKLTVHVITGDTFGKAQSALKVAPCSLVVLPTLSQATAKQSYILKRGPSGCAAIGNGRNDRHMLQLAALGIAVIQAEGAAVATITSADVIVTEVMMAFDLLLNPLRLVATLRD